MKNSKFVKLATLITVCALLMGTIVGVGITAGATSTDADVVVANANIAYNDMMQLAINLTCNEELADGAALGILVWNETVTDTLTAENATHSSFTEKEDDNGVKYFTTNGISAKDIDNEYRIAGCIKAADGTIRIGTVTEYSIIEYLENRIENDNPTEAQLNLYNAIINYGKAAGKIKFGTSEE